MNTNVVTLVVGGHDYSSIATFFWYSIIPALLIIWKRDVAGLWAKRVLGVVPSKGSEVIFDDHADRIDELKKQVEELKKLVAK